MNPNSTEGPRTDRRPRVAAAVYFAVQGASFAALVTRIPALQSKFDLSDGALAAILAVVPVVAGVGSVLAGHLVPKYGSANVLRVAGPVVPLSLVAVGAAASLPALLSVLIAVGLGLGAVDACMNMQGVGVQAAYGRSLMGSFHATWSLASIVGALAAAAAAAADLTLWAFFGILAVLFVPFQLAAGPSLLKTREANDAGPDIATRSVPWRPILLIGALVTCVYMIDSSASNWSAVYLHQGLGSPESIAALAYGGYALATMLGRTAVDRLVPRVGPVNLVRAGGALATAALILVAAAPGPVVGLIGFGLLGLGLCPAIPLSFVAADQHDPAGNGVAVARVNVFNYVGFVVGAPLIGLVSEASSLRWAFAALSPVAIAVAALAPRLRSHQPTARQTTST